MKLKTTRYTVCSDRLPEQFAGCRIAMLSDLHDTVYGESNDKLFEVINNEQPDIVIIAGDLVTAKAGRDFSPAFNLLKKLASKYPVYYALGNHEQRAYNEVKEYLQKVRDLSGVILLDNETVIAGCGIRIAGLSLPIRFYKKAGKIIAKASDVCEQLGTKDEGYTILVAHNPIFFKAYSEWGADLVLSGHLHGGIVRLPFVGGVVSPQVSFFPKYDKGMFTKGKSTLIVSAGLGKHTIPIRLWNPAELVVIDLKK